MARAGRVAKRAWDESKHPRDGRGRFSSEGSAAWVSRVDAQLASRGLPSLSQQRVAGARERVSSLHGERLGGNVQWADLVGARLDRSVTRDLTQSTTSGKVNSMTDKTPTGPATPKINRRAAYRGAQVSIVSRDGSVVSGLVFESGASRMTIVDDQGKRHSFYPASIAAIHERDYNLHPRTTQAPNRN